MPCHPKRTPHCPAHHTTLVAEPNRVSSCLPCAWHGAHEELGSPVFDVHVYMFSTTPYTYCSLLNWLCIAVCTGGCLGQDPKHYEFWNPDVYGNLLTTGVHPLHFRTCRHFSAHRSTHQHTSAHSIEPPIPSESYCLAMAPLTAMPADRCPQSPSAPAHTLTCMVCTCAVPLAWHTW